MPTVGLNRERCGVHCVLTLARVEPRQALLAKILPRRLKPGCLIERADMEVGYRRGRQAFAGQRRPAPGTESAPGLTWRRIEFGYFSFGDRISFAIECHEHRNWRASMPPTTLAMTPIYPLGLTGCDKTDLTAKAATLQLLGRAHYLILTRFGVT
jgi:hypothetical protein